MREIITLQCNDCKNRNYTTTKNKKKHTEPHGDEEILQHVQKAYRSPRGEVTEASARSI